MKILFVVPYHSFGIDKELGMNQKGPPLGIAYLHAFMKQNNIESRIFDARAYKRPVKALRDVINEYRPDIAGINIHCTSEMDDGAFIADRIKEIDCDIKVVAGGSHPSALPEDTLNRYKSIDYVVFGEGEFTLKELIDAIKNKADLNTIDGLAYRQKDGITVNKPRELVSEIDSFPMPDFDGFPFDKYKPHYFKGIEIPVITARGCPNRCVFCYQPMGHNVRTRSYRLVVEEIERDIKVYGATQIFFADDTLTIEPEYTINLFNEITRRGLNKVRYIASTRIDRVNKDMLKAMKEANVFSIVYGAECGNQRILDGIRKGFTLEQTEQAIRWTKEAGIRVDTNFILGLPYENEETIRQTLDFIMKLNPDFINLAILAPFPSTEVYEWAKNGIGGLRLKSDSYEATGRIVGNTLELESVPRERLEYFQTLGYVKFYLRPSRIRNLFYKVDFSTLLKFAVHLVINQIRKILRKN
ncbi:MAG: B12-binding domain-containing radical SAM protein [Deltaproteobacteria bacterium]|nr:B12-binding domain-containing radical SAM protein [Deltaproteobacteria bacterium]